MKSVLISIQPYWVFLIIARLMGWDIPQEKTIEVRKNFPKDSAWNKRVLIYCSKNRKSFNHIPKEYQPLMKKFSGCVIGEFMCDRIEKLYIPISMSATPPDKETVEKTTCLSLDELKKYAKGNMFLYGWHISDLRIYDTSKELGEFRTPCPQEFADKYDCSKGNRTCKYFIEDEGYFECGKEGLTRPPQSWQLVEEL